MAKKLVCVLLVLLAAFSGAVYWYLHGFNSNANLATGALVHFTIKDGMTTRDIAALLHEEKAVRSPELFLLTAKLTHKESMLKAGNYEITAGMSDAEIIDIIASGKKLRASLRLRPNWKKESWVRPKLSNKRPLIMHRILIWRRPIPM